MKITKTIWIFYFKLNLLVINGLLLENSNYNYITEKNNEEFLRYFDTIEIIQQWSNHDIELKCSNNMFHSFNVYWYFKPCLIDLYQKTCKDRNSNDNDNYEQNWIKIPCFHDSISLSSLNSFCQSSETVTILHIKNATENNIGLYKCVVQPYNSHIKRLATVEIQIQMFYVDIKNYIKLTLSESLQLPTFVENLSTNITATYGTKVIFQCRVYSRLHTTIRWFRNIQQINHNNNNQLERNELDHFHHHRNHHLSNSLNNGDEYNKNLLEYFNKTYRRIETPKEKIISSNIYLSKLILNNITNEDEGNYACVAVNIRGHSIFETYLEVLPFFSSNSSPSYALNYSLRTGSNNSLSINFLLLFLMPVGLALLPLILWLIFILYKKYSKSNQDSDDIANQMQRIVSENTECNCNNNSDQL